MAVSKIGIWLTARGAVLAALLFGGAGCQAQRTQRPESCYSDERCLVSTAVDRAGAVSDVRVQSLVEALARLGEFKLAQEQAARLNSALPQPTEAARSIAVYEIARAAVANPSKVASLAPIERLNDEPFRYALDVDLAADAILHRSPWGAMDSRLSQVLRPMVVRHAANATLDFILKTELPAESAKLRPAEQEVVWNDIAKDWLEVGDRAAAERALERADAARSAPREPVGPTGDTWRGWMEFGDFGRALRATSSLTPGDRGSMQLEIAKQLADAGLRSRARSVLVAAYPDLQSEPDNLIGQTLYRFVRAAFRSGDLALARKAAAQIAATAEKPHPLQAIALENAAIAYNEIGDQGRADAYLRRAVALVPGDEPMMGVSDFGSSMRIELAEQFARAGDEAMFEAQYKQLSPHWQARYWSEVCDPDWSQRPSDAVCAQHVGADFLLQRAIGLAKSKNDEAASQDLTSAIRGYRKSAPDEAVRGFIACARLAYVIGRTDQLRTALIEAARAADEMDNAGESADFLAQVAALRSELVG